MGVNLTVRSESWGAEDRSWTKSTKGYNTCRSKTLDLALFDPEDHYPNGYLPSGIVLGVVTATGRYVPYTDAATHGAGSDVARGFLFSSVTVPEDTAERIGVPLMWEGIIDTTELPLNHGLTTAARADLIHFLFEP